MSEPFVAALTCIGAGFSLAVLTVIFFVIIWFIKESIFFLLDQWKLGREIEKEK